MKKYSLVAALVLAMTACDSDKVTQHEKVPRPIVETGNVLNTSADGAAKGIESESGPTTPPYSSGSSENVVLAKADLRFYGTIDCVEKLNTDAYKKFQSFHAEAIIKLRSGEEILGPHVGTDAKVTFASAAIRPYVLTPIIPYQCSDGNLLLNFEFWGPEAPVRPGIALSIPCSEINDDLVRKSGETLSNLNYYLSLKCSDNDTLVLLDRKTYSLD